MFCILQGSCPCLSAISTLAKQQPTNQTPVWSRLDLSHLGLSMADNSIIAKLHNRSYTGAQLKHFSATNLKKDPVDKDLFFKPLREGVMKQTYNVKQIATLGEAVMALLNCELIMRHLHPCDYGTTAICRFLIERINHSDDRLKIKIIQQVCSFFQAAFKENADRVLGPEHPRTYPEIVTFYNSMGWYNNEGNQGSLLGGSGSVGSPNSEGKGKKRQNSSSRDGLTNDKNVEKLTYFKH